MKSNWDFNDIVGIEGDENRYRIYRHGKSNYEDLLDNHISCSMKGMMLQVNGRIYLPFVIDKR